MKKLSAQFNKQKALVRRSLWAKAGFTLIELLVVIVIIATLAVTVFVALNPAERIRDARDARRTSDVDSILTAIHAYIVDNNGLLPTGLVADGTERHIGTSTGTPSCVISTGGCNVTVSTNCSNLTTSLANYLASVPTDPNGGTDVLTRYSALVATNGIVTVKACGTEGSTNISSSR